MEGNSSLAVKPEGVFPRYPGTSLPRSILALRHEREHAPQVRMRRSRPGRSPAVSYRPRTPSPHPSMFGDRRADGGESKVKRATPAASPRQRFHARPRTANECINTRGGIASAALNLSATSGLDAVHHDRPLQLAVDRLLRSTPPGSGNRARRKPRRVRSWEPRRDRGPISPTTVLGERSSLRLRSTQVGSEADDADGATRVRGTPETLPSVSVVPPLAHAVAISSVVRPRHA